MTSISPRRDYWAEVAEEVGARNGMTRDEVFAAGEPKRRPAARKIVSGSRGAVLLDANRVEAPSLFVDLGPYLRGEVEEARPSLGLVRAKDGLRLLYPGLEHLVIGETEGGKSWLALACAAAELDAGRTVIYMHFEESSPMDSISRLRLLGVPDGVIGERFRYVSPEGPLTAATVAELAELRASLAVVDGYNEALALHGCDIMKPDGIADFRALVVKPLTATGAAVVVLDHVVKDTDRNGGGYALGSVHKVNAVNGAVFLMESQEAFGKGRRGAARLYVTKDRPGHLRAHGEATKVARKFRIGMMSIESSVGEPFGLAWWPPVPEEEREQNDKFDDEKVFVAVKDLVGRPENAGLAATADIVALLGMRKQTVTAALDRLVTREGRLQRDKAGRTVVYMVPPVTEPGERVELFPDEGQ